MLHVVLPAFVVGFSVLFHILVCHLKPYKRTRDISEIRKVLFVVAHPDDECMFFGPTVVHLCRSGCEVHLLCLSSGNYYKQGRIRKEELRKSCEILGIDPSYVTVIQHTKLPDDPKIKWREDIVGNIILKYILQSDIEAVMTFDHSGVSGHYNHISLFYGLSYLCKEGLMPSDCKVFILKTVNIIRKYIGILDVPWSYLTAKYAYVLSHKDIALPQRAMYAHYSQMVWFRWLYIYCSRYMIINTYDLLDPNSDYEDDDDDSYCDSDTEKID